MKFRSGSPTTDPPIRAISRKLVATRRAPNPRHECDKYDSSDRLPRMEKLFDQTAQQIQWIHLVPGRSQKSFDRLWNQVCKKLTKFGNASAYARRKRHDLARNLDEFAKMDAAVAEAWASGLTPTSSAGTGSYSAFDATQFLQLWEERSELRLAIDASINHVLEVAIAYWIEAMHAHLAGDDLRAMHTLIPCHFHLGLAHAFRMTHDTKAADGRRAGQKERDALADVVLNVMEGFKVSKSIHNEDHLLERITHVIEATPSYARVLHAYDALASAGKRTVDEIGIRFPSTLRTWVIGKKPLYPQLADAFQNLANQVKN